MPPLANNDLGKMQIEFIEEEISATSVRKILFIKYHPVLNDDLDKM
jgi:hypothetical protein